MKKRSREPDNRRRIRFPNPIQVIGGIFAALFLFMSVYLCHYAYTNRQVMMSNSYNTRQKILVEQNVRGDILSRDGTILAHSATGADGKEIREYPFANLFSHVIGFATKGKSGVEALENYYLLRSDISLSEKARYTDEEQKYPGDVVTTSLDIGLQQTAYKALAAYRGAIVATDVRTGEILAMVSKPDFDPNEIDQIWGDLVAAGEGDSRLVNRVTQGIYPPGSTFKIITALEYIRENPTTYRNFRFRCGGHFTHDGETIHCFHGESHGDVDFYKAFQKSCNSSFANIGVSLDHAAFAATLKELRFGEEMPLELPYTKSRAAIDVDTSDGDVMQLSIGQGTTAMTPMHLNMITQVIANGGVMLAPRIILSVDSADGKNIRQSDVQEIGRVMSGEEAQILTEMMTLVVNGGTGKRLEGLAYQAAGKTGSAEFNSQQKTESHAWFTGFAPAEDPRIAVTVIVEEAGGGGEYAVPMAKRMFDAFFGL